jgi:hypothetical protein
MDVKKRVEKALSAAFGDAYVRLEEDDGISGFVVASHFKGMPTLDRQALIDDAISKADPALDADEKRQVLMIAALSPSEFNSVGAKVRVHKIRQMANAVEVVLRGGHSDAEYVRGALNNQTGVRTTEPKQVPGAIGALVSFRARGSAADPLDKARVLRVLKNDPYIEVMPDA